MTPIFRKVLLPICYERVAAFSRILSKEIIKKCDDMWGTRTGSKCILCRPVL